jgi:hypothetical protein
MAKAPEDRYASCHDLVRDLELALDDAVQLPGTTRTSRRAAANHARAAEEAASANTSAGPETETEIETGTGTEEGTAPSRTSGWVSHPSFPPGVIEPVPGATDASGNPDAATDQDLTYVTGGDDASYAGSEAGWDADEEEPWEDNAPAAPEGAAPSRRPRRWLVIAIAAATIVALMVVAAVYLLPSRTTEPFRTFASPSTIVPYTVSHPQSWAEQNGVASDAVLSPRPDAVGRTFFQGSADRWGGTRRLMATSPADAVGLYVYAESTASDTTTEGLKSAISVLLPDRLTFAPMHRQLTIDGSPADELEGVLEDPTDPRTKLHVLFDVVQPQGGGSVLLAFFAAPDRFDDQRPLFDRIRDGVKFQG